MDDMFTDQADANEAADRKRAQQKRAAKKFVTVRVPKPLYYKLKMESDKSMMPLIRVAHIMLAYYALAEEPQEVLDTAFKAVKPKIKDFTG